MQSLILEKVYHQAPGSSDEWPDEWFERAAIWEGALADRQRIEQERAERDATMARGRKG